MKKLKRNDIAIIVSVIIICINNVILSKRDYSYECNVNSEIAKSVIALEKDELIEMDIDESSFPIEYNFSIKNYDEKNINEVDFDYVIEIQNSVENFPVSYTLKDVDNNTEIKLINGKTETLKIRKNTKETRNFKLCMQWRELDDDLAGQLELKLKVRAVQSKEE